MTIMNFLPLFYDVELLWSSCGRILPHVALMLCLNVSCSPLLFDKHSPMYSKYNIGTTEGAEDLRK